MKEKTKHSALVWLATSMLLVGLTALVGCKASEPKSKAVTKAAPTEDVARPAVQTTCPVMGMAINKNVYTEYKGQKVYFCCPSCIDLFKKEPEKYIAKLPQFDK